MQCAGALIAISGAEPGAWSVPTLGGGYWLLTRRSLHDPADIAYYARSCPRRSTWSRWRRRQYQTRICRHRRYSSRMS